jgi:hypothetical protein
MKTRTMWLIVTIVVALVLMAGVAGAVPGQMAPEDTVPHKINYQGRLTSPDGTPLDGTFPMRFQIYNAAGGGTMLWDSGSLSVNVDNGLFNVELEVDPSAFNGQALWLRIHVDGEWLSPRQELLPVPYALSLRPGTVIEGEPAGAEGAVLEVDMSGYYPLGKALWGTASTGSAVLGRSPDGYGLLGYSENSAAVYGRDDGTQQAKGYGGYFTSNTGVGVYGYSSAISVVSNAYTPGVWGRSANGIGVYGEGGNGKPGVWGVSDGTGVSGTTRGTSATAYGVFGRAGGGAYAIYGHQDSETGGLAVWGKNDGGGTGVSGTNLGSGHGTWGYSAAANGVTGATGRADRNYGLHTLDNLYSRNYHTSGAVMQVVQNGSAESLERGDLVEIAGLDTAARTAGPPTIQVRRAEGANSTAVIGVVASNYPGEWLDESAAADPTGATGPETEIPLAEPGPIAPGELLLVVVQGPAQVKASALSGAIHTGDLLSSADQPGQAVKAAQLQVEGVTAALPGTVFGKALEPLDAGKGLVYVFVTLQ